MARNASSSHSTRDEASSRLTNTCRSLDGYVDPPAPDSCRLPISPRLTRIVWRAKDLETMGQSLPAQLAEYIMSMDSGTDYQSLSQPVVKLSCNGYSVSFIFKDYKGLD